jgi:hypothetical protein
MGKRHRFVFASSSHPLPSIDFVRFTQIVTVDSHGHGSHLPNAIFHVSSDQYGNLGRTRSSDRKHFRSLRSIRTPSLTLLVPFIVLDPHHHIRFLELQTVACGFWPSSCRFV